MLKCCAGAFSVGYPIRNPRLCRPGFQDLGVEGLLRKVVKVPEGKARNYAVGDLFADQLFKKGCALSAKV